MENHSEETGDGIDAVAMTRQIRDERHKRVENMTPEERLEYYREKSASAHERFMRRIRNADEEAS